MTQATQDYNGAEQYAYDASNRRVWRCSGSATEYVILYGVFGEELGEFTVSPEAGGSFGHGKRKIYFGGRVTGAASPTG